jgi:NHLM bacteriocin system ABC transporter peptidase/ATP-binding protein
MASAGPTAAQQPRAPTGKLRARVRTPTLLQMEAVECGAAALGIVLAHYERWVPLEELRDACGVSRDGSRASNIVKAARAYGLEAKGLRIEPDALGGLRLPVIVFWGFNHFVVVEGYGPRGVHLNDPATGPRFIDWEEFDSSFTGIALTFQPGHDFTPAGSAPSVVRGLASRLRGGAPAILLVLLAGLALLVPGLLVPAAVRIFVDQVLSGGDRSWLWILVPGVALAALVQLVLTSLQQITLLQLATRLSLSMSTRFFEHVLRLPLRFFDQRYAGHVVTRLQVNDEIASLLSSELSASLLGVLTSVFYLVLMAVYDWQLTLLAVAFAACNFVALQAMARRQRDVNRRIVQDSGKLTATAVSGLQNIETLKATSEDASFFARWAGQQAKVVTAMQGLGQLTALLVTVPILVTGLNAAVVLGFGGWQVMTGQISLGTLVAFQLLVTGFIAPIGRLLGFGATLQQAAGSLASVDDILNYPPDPELPLRERDLPSPEGNGRMNGGHAPPLDGGRLSGALELVDLTFGYDPTEPPLIEHFSLALEPGERIAIVGATGSGKSTVAKLVAGLNNPWSGDVLLDGIPRQRIPRRVLAATLAFVDQEILLFEGTVRDNLTLWDPTVTQEAVVRGARDAEIQDDILGRPDGYDRPIQEGGRDWSGGQRQRLEIARALAGDPALLVLDEATSALDPLVEQLIDRNIRARGCSCLIVAHRLSTIRDCHEIVVLDRGVVAQRGTHDELMRSAGLYAELVRE